MLRNLVILVGILFSNISNAEAYLSLGAAADNERVKLYQFGRSMDLYDLVYLSRFGGEVTKTKKHFMEYKPSNGNRIDRAISKRIRRCPFFKHH